MESKAKLTIILKADETVVAEVENPILWQKILGALHEKNDKEFLGGEKSEDGEEFAIGDSNDVSRFAKSLNVSIPVLQAALSPSKEPPYLTLDHHNWEKFRKLMPERGKNSVSPTGFAGTALALWIKEAKIDINPTQKLVGKILDTINIEDHNSSRGIKNTTWLQGRDGGVIVIKPTEISKAQKVVRVYCLGENEEEK